MNNSRNYVKDIQELIVELERKEFIPKRFRNAEFTDSLRLTYIEYLKKEIRRLESVKRN